VVFHHGACSDTMETDGRYVLDNNYRYSMALLRWCQDEGVPLVYASSAAVYGLGPKFAEGRGNEHPLNVYGYSKFLFDQIVRRELPRLKAPVIGLRYFNVYGPHEAHKGRMASVAYHAFNQFMDQGSVKLFVGCDGYGDGEQRRDFVHVDDVVNVNLHFIEHREVSGIFNCGTGRAQSFNDVARAVVNGVRAARGDPALELSEMAAQGLIQYVPFPPQLVGKYQSFTEADMSLLRSAGCVDEFMSVEQGVGAYVRDLLAARG